MRVVLDTCILEAARRSSRGASFVVLQLLLSRQIEGCVSIGLWMEYQDVLLRSSNALAGERLLSAIADRLIPVPTVAALRPLTADPADNHVAEAAIFGGAACLITHNIRDFADFSKDYRFRVVTPKTFLEEVYHDRSC